MGARGVIEILIRNYLDLSWANFMNSEFDFCMKEGVFLIRL